MTFMQVRCKIYLVILSHSESLKRRSQKLVTSLNKLPGVKCNPAEGAMYVFVKLEFPEKFIKEAQQIKKHPDTLYCLQLLEKTGVCVVPGNGFGQLPGTFHFRSTFLPPEDQFDQFLNYFTSFHLQFMKDYGKSE
eukprot:NODE_27_length_39007_cov_1.590650.p30 type:complete len:135 gc:universal NODE_27_length_39007_cov_1.590650:35651-35247(-)